MNLLNKAEALAEALLQKARHEEETIVWEIEKVDASGNHLRKYDYGLSHGMAGIVMFFGALYKSNQDKRLLEVIAKSSAGLDHVLKQEASADYSLAHGKAGIIWLYCQLYTITNQQAYLEKAIELSEGAQQYLTNTNTNDSLLNGRAGLAWVLLQLYNLTEDEATLVRLSTATRIILWNAKNLKSSLCWYYNQTQSGPILGWAKGVAGISYFLNALNHCSEGDGLAELLSKAMKGIEQGWNDEMQNWPDHGLVIDTAEKDRAISEQMRSEKGREQALRGKDHIDFRNGSLGILNFFTKAGPSDFIRLAEQEHKAYKTLLSRTDELIYPEDLHVFLDLLNGSEQEEVEQVKMKCEEYLQQIDTNDKDLGLQKGLAGWAYLALQLHANEEHCLMLSSKGIPQKVNALLSSKLTGFDKHFPLYQAFPGTTGLLDEGALQAVKASLKSTPFCTLSLSELTRVLEEQVKKMSGPTAEIITDAFEFEKVILDKKEECLATIVPFVNKVYFFENNRKLQELRDEQLLEVTLKFRPTTEAYELCFDATLKNIEKYNDIRNIDRADCYFLLTPTDSQDLVRNIKLPELDELVVHFEETISGGELHQALCAELEMDGAKREALKERIVDLILAQVLDGTIEVA